MLKNEKGITLLILVITVIIMALLAAATVNYGVNSLNTVKLQNFSYEMQQIQGKVDVIYEKIQNGDESYIILGNNITDSTEAMATLYAVTGINYSGMTDADKATYYYQSNFTYYRYLTESDLENLLDISSSPGDVIINFMTQEVISVEGFEYEGTTYYRLSDI